MPLPLPSLMSSQLLEVSLEMLLQQSVEVSMVLAKASIARSVHMEILLWTMAMASRIGPKLQLLGLELLPILWD